MKQETQIEQTNAEVAEELLKIWDTMYTSTEKWDVNVAKSIWTEDGINMPVYGISQNRQEMLDFIKDIVVNNKWEFVEFKPLELFVHDDLAYEFSLVEHNITPNNGEETVNTKMRCISVYKKVNGVWKIHRFMPQYSME